jgi:flagellar biosynthesis protein FlhA
MALSNKTKDQLLQRASEAWLPLALFGVVMLLIMPVPPIILDMSLSLSIALALLVLLVVLSIKDPADFTGFPTLLLMSTLFRLSLNVASTRLILLDGYAGNIIEAFGNFVVRGNYIVGLVVFTILVLVNFIVITKGAGRVAEVAARFTLDAMPGKQMSIDAELNAGVIDDKQARARRRKIEEEADFYGAMDGASKFVRGDAIAGILITLINVVGGFGIGIFQNQMSVIDALQLYSLLSIGDGLVSQIPALITSVAAGILVTRATAKENLASELTGQLLASDRSIWMLCGMLTLLAIVPGFPFLPFITLAIITGLVAKNLNAIKEVTVNSTDPDNPDQKASTQTPAQKQQEEPIENLLKLDPLQIELGYGLVHLADKRKGGDLLTRITGIRKNFAKEMGMVVPPIKVRDNLQMKPNHYRFIFKGEEIVQGEIIPGQSLAMNATESTTILKGVPTVEPVYNLPATWIAEPEKKKAELNGYTVVDATTVLVTHLSETVKRNAAELLGRQDVQSLLDHVKEANPAVVNELVPEQLTVGQIQRVLQNLLAEGLSLRNLVGILERVSDYAPHTKNIDELSEQARLAVGSAIVAPLLAEDKSLSVITLEPALESLLNKGLRKTTNELSLIIDPEHARHLLQSLSTHIQQMIGAGLHPVIISGPQIRIALFRFLHATHKDLKVVSFAEVPNATNLKSFSVIACPDTRVPEPELQAH